MIQVDILREPELEFRSGRHVDIRFGIRNHGPFDRGTSSTNGTIRLGVVGTPQSVDSLLRWLDRCSAGVAAKDSKRPNLFPAFPGFGVDSPFGCSFSIDPRFRRTIPLHIITRLEGAADHNALVKDAVQIFIDELKYLDTAVDVLICAPPAELFDLVDPGTRQVALDEDDDEEPEDPEFRSGRFVFHHLLKAQAMQLRRPVQLVRPRTYGGKTTRSQHRRKTKEPKSFQDEATRAWNFHTALYYKAGGVPWRLVRESSDLATCYVGVSFYRSLDETTVMTSLAQVFNERGDGLVVRGGQARVLKDDRSPHLSDVDAARVMTDALRLYRDEHKTLPARIVLHKSSHFLPDERDGFLKAIDNAGIEYCDLLSIRRTLTRALRIGTYPPLRGTRIRPTESMDILYTRGSVPFFEAYPGLYVPRPLDIRYERIEQSPDFLTREILALSKMNWNNTQFDGSEPITLRAARQVGSILKYLGDHESVHSRYSYYM